MLESPQTPVVGGDYGPVQEPAGSASLSTSPNSRWALYARKWFAVRWNLSRTVFARPVPFLTEWFEIKRGDLIITLPVAIAIIAIAAAACSSSDVSGSGSPPALALVVVFAFAVRNNALLIPATGISFERALMYHKLYGFVAWVAAALHGIAYLRGKDDKDYDNGTVWTGVITFAAMTGLVVFSFYIIRRHFFELFLRFHWVLFVVVAVAGVIHGAALMLVGFVPWLLDVVYRYGYRSRQFTRQHAGQVTIALVSKDIVRVQFPRAGGIESNDALFKYEAGQYVFICVPDVSKLEWHPFSIASAPHEPMITLYIRVSGDWTKKLAALAGSKASGQPLTILLDGPYGAVSVQRDHYSHVVFVSGGIGVTPMLSLANDLYHQTLVTKSRRSPLQKAWFLWSVRDRETIEAVILDEARTNQHQQESWLSPALASPRSGNSRAADVFYAEFALSRDAQDLTHDVDQQLAICLLHGQRPDIPKALREIGEMAVRDQSERSVRVAVLVCGPQAMISSVLNTSMKLSKEISGVVFDVHSEVFDF